MSISRREALQRMIAVTGTIMIGAEVILTGCAPKTANRGTPFTADEVKLLDEIADTILPATNTPGAKEAGAGLFMTTIVRDCYGDDNFEVFRSGLAAVDKACNKQHGKPFAEASAPERTALLTALDAEQKQYGRTRKSGDPQHYFSLMKDLAIFAYFSSEAGATKALHYVESPGSYNGDVPYTRGQRGWYNPTRRIG